MSVRTTLTVPLLLMLLCMSVTAQAAKKKPQLAVALSPSSSALPLVTLAATNASLGEVAERLAKELKAPVDVSAAARLLQVTSKVRRQPLEKTLRALAPQSYVDGILSGAKGPMTILAIHLRAAGEAPPSLADLKKRSSETFMFFAHTEDPSFDPLQGQLEVTLREDRLRIAGKRQPLSVVVARIAEVLNIPFELVGDSREVIDIAVSDATVEDAMSALPASVKLYLRKDLGALETTPVRLVLDERPPETTP